MDTQQRLHEIEIWLTKIDGRLERYNELLADHIRRTEQNEAAIQAHDKKLDEALEPMRWLKSTGRIVGWIGGIATVLIAIYEIIKLIVR